mmetsp:Transcript_30032/g.40667  ORF Transcript_30032/g.40667 Transcript_30032/m.40667 type:complete len:80 (-) Transcript_30032:306-545(-)
MINEQEGRDYLVAFSQKLNQNIYIYKRPYIKKFLKRVSELGTVSVFTASPKSYADPIIDKLDPDNKIFKHRFFQDDCEN